MARIRPAKSQTETGIGKGVTPPEPRTRRRPPRTGDDETPRVRAPEEPSSDGGGIGEAAVAPVGRASRFLQEVAAELRKVSWPNRQQLFQSTLVVLICVAVVAAYLGVLDAIFRRFVDAVF